MSHPSWYFISIAYIAVAAVILVAVIAQSNIARTEVEYIGRSIINCIILSTLNQFVLGLLSERKDERTSIDEIFILLICLENCMRCVASKLLAVLTFDNHNYIIFQMRLCPETSLIESISSCSVESLKHKLATIKPFL
jgi:hypothetical protein